MKLIAALLIGTLGFSQYFIMKNTNTYGFQEPDEWKLAKSKNEVLVYTRVVDGYKIKEFKAITTIHSTEPEIVKVLMYAEQFPDWMKDIANSRTVESKDNGDKLTYYQVQVPWPLQDRDAVGDMDISRDGQKTTININLLPDYMPEKPNLVRMRNATGSWTVEKTDDASCTVTYQFIADPESNVPGWIANLFIVDAPYETLINLRERLENSEPD